MSTTPTPPNGMVSNTELILRKILGEDVTPLPPNSRVEFYLMLVKDLIAQLQSAVNLKGETATPLTDNATTNPIMIDGKSYTAIMNDAVIYQSGEFIFDGTKWHELGDLSNLASVNIGAMTGYSKPSETSAIVVADTLNTAIGKLEKALDLKQSTIDSDHKLSADNVDDTNATNKFATAAELDQINTNKNNISSLLLDGTLKRNDLNDVAVNEFAVYHSMSANLPVVDYCFVRTSVNSGMPLMSRLQEAFVMSTGESYVRTMDNGTWQTWLKITNPTT